MIQMFFDTETTGVEIGACVIEIGALLIEDGRIVDTFHEYGNPSRRVSDGAYQAHHMDNEYLSQFPPESVMLKHFIEWFYGNAPDEILAYNAQFDVRIITDRIKMDGIMERDIFEHYKVTDVAKLARTAISRGLIPAQGRKWNQVYVAEQLGIKYEAHSAIEDVKAMYQIYCKLDQLLKG